MVEVILDPETCPACGGDVPAPADGRWRFARGHKFYDSMEAAEAKIAMFADRTDNLRRFEFRAVLDNAGNVRIASRRRLDS
jgi:hypothetical protein